jgi:Mn2+/Fe2+ NRAMP family transporter
MTALSLEYLGLVLLASLGVFQAAAAYSRLKGLSFFGRPRWGYLFAAVTIIPSLAALFTWNMRNATGIIEGSQQLGLLSLAIVAAFLLTLAASSIVNGSRLRSDTTIPAGIEAFREATFFQLLRQRFGRRR